jgi:hypothetical protein
MTLPTCKIAHHGIMQPDPVYDRLEFMEWVCRICGLRLYGINAQEPRYVEPGEQLKTSGAYPRWESNPRSVMSDGKGSTRIKRAPR